MLHLSPKEVNYAKNKIEELSNLKSIAEKNNNSDLIQFI